MATPTSRATVVVVPLFRRHLLWHLVPPPTPLTPSPPPPSWRGGVTLSDKLTRAQAQAIAAVKGRLAATWASLETARNGSIKFWMYRGAQAVLAREHPDTAFLRAVAAARARGDGGAGGGGSSPSPPLFITHAASAPLRYVRRRTRLLAASEASLRRKGVAWAAATVASLPLFLLPLPAFPVYFCAWKAWSARCAAKGAAALGADLAAADAAGAVSVSVPLDTPFFDVFRDARLYAYFRSATPHALTFHPGGGGGPAVAAAGEAAVTAAPLYLDALARDAAAVRDLPRWPGEGESEGAAAATPSTPLGTPPLYASTPVIDDLADPPARAGGSPLPPAAAAALAAALPARGLEAAAARARAGGGWGPRSRTTRGRCRREKCCVCGCVGVGELKQIVITKTSGIKTEKSKSPVFHVLPSLTSAATPVSAYSSHPGIASVASLIISINSSADGAAAATAGGGGGRPRGGGRAA